MKLITKLITSPPHSCISGHEVLCATPSARVKCFVNGIILVQTCVKPGIFLRMLRQITINVRDVSIRSCAPVRCRMGPTDIRRSIVRVRRNRRTSITRRRWPMCLWAWREIRVSMRIEYWPDRCLGHLETWLWSEHHTVSVLATCLSSRCRLLS